MLQKLKLETKLYFLASDVKLLFVKSYI